MKRMIILLGSVFCLLLSGCMSEKQHMELLERLDTDLISPVAESNLNIWGERTGTVYKCGDLIFYCRYTYEHQKYNQSREDGLYVKSADGAFTYKLADGVICSVVVRQDGIYYLKLRQMGEIYLYNYDLYRYNFQTGKNEQIIEACSYVQFSEDAVYYCPHYMGNKNFFVEKGLPLDIENEGKIVKHSLLTGEETVIAEVDGGIYDFIVSEGILAFSGGSGGYELYGGKNLYVCNLDGSGLRKLIDNTEGYINVLSVNKETNRVFYSINVEGGSAYCCVAADDGTLIWSYPWSELTEAGARNPIVFQEKVYFAISDETNDSYSGTAFLKPMGNSAQICFVEDFKISSTLYAYRHYVFAGDLYLYDQSSHTLYTIADT